MKERRPLALCVLVTVIAAFAVLAASCQNPTGGSGSKSSSGSSSGGGSSGSEPEPAEPAPALRGGIVVNEFLPDPNGASSVDTDGNGTASTTDEFVELYNAASAPVDISGLELWDPSAGAWFTVPDGTSLEADAVALIVVGVADDGSLPAVASGAAAFDAGHSRGIINNSGDNVLLLDPDAGDYLQAVYNGESAVDPATDLAGDGFPADAVRVGEISDWGSDTDGASLARNPDGMTPTTVHLELGPPASPGEVNAP